MRRVTALSVAFVVSVVVLLLTGTCQAGSKWTVGKTWTADQQVSMDQIDHAGWDALLEKYVDQNGNVDYQAWKAGGAQQLDQYLAELSKASIHKSASKEGKLAFWINAYNAVTVKGILREYPTTSIRNHTAKAFGYNIWHDLLLSVGDSRFSLDQMEHKILRKMGEPRIHFAIVCASVGCPRLLNEAYVANRVENQLAANTKQFFADPARFRFDASRQQIWLSPILDWFGEDFGPNQAAQLRTIAPYLPPSAQPLARSGKASVTLLDYDWNLNDRARVGRSGAGSRR